MELPQRRARKAEQETADRHGARLTPASGSGTIKNDARNDEWSIEVKSTSAWTYGLDQSVLAIAENNALVDGRRMLLVVTFVPKRAQPGRAKRYVVMSEDDHLERELDLERYRAAVKRLDDENWQLWSKIEEC